MKSYMSFCTVTNLILRKIIIFKSKHRNTKSFGTLIQPKLMQKEEGKTVSHLNPIFEKDYVADQKFHTLAHSRKGSVDSENNFKKSAMMNTKDDRYEFSIISLDF